MASVLVHRCFAKTKGIGVTEYKERCRTADDDGPKEKRDQAEMWRSAQLCLSIAVGDRQEADVIEAKMKMKSKPSQKWKQSEETESKRRVLSRQRCG